MGFITYLLTYFITFFSLLVRFFRPAAEGCTLVAGRCWRRSADLPSYSGLNSATDPFNSATDPFQCSRKGLSDVQPGEDTVGAKEGAF